jgi:hypothetical protein
MRYVNCRNQAIALTIRTGWARNSGQMTGNPEGIPALSYSFCRRLAHTAVRLAGRGRPALHKSNKQPKRRGSG